MKKYFYLAITSIFVVLIACNNNNDDDNDNNSSFTISNQLTNVFDNGIISRADSFIEEAKIFQSLVEDFNNAPTQENLEDLQSAWKILKLTWKPLEVLTFGVDVSITSKINNIDFWPISTEDIDGVIEQNESIVDLSLLLSTNNRILGLAAIEYILFEESLMSFVGDEYSINRKNYLLAQAGYIVNQAEEYKNAQLLNEDTFKNAATKSVTGTQNFLFNAVVFKLEEISNLKIGEALGVNTGILNANSTEAPYSEFSLDIIRREIEQIESVFTGEFDQNSTDDGFYKELKSLGREDLIEELEFRLQTVYNQLNEITISLEQQIVVDNSLVLNLRLAINELETIIKVDVQSALDIILTFSDNDGD